VTTSRELWYLTRGSGVVALLLLTASVVVGVLAALRVRSDRWPRFAVGSVHRNVTLLSIAFVVLHVVTTVADGYAPIGLKDAVVPFASPYRPLWLGLGAVAFDLVLALAITSYLRHRIGVRLWRGLHWLAYVAWPVAVLHSFGTGSDARFTWLTMLGVLSVAAVALAVLARAAATPAASPVRVGGAALALLVPLALAGWYVQGPARGGWAARAGTPRTLMASRRRAIPRTVVATATSASPPREFTSRVRGTIHEAQRSDGRVDVSIVLRLLGGPGGALRVDLRGQPIGDGVSMEASGMSLVPASTRALYEGAVTALEGSTVAGTVRDAAGDTLDLTIALSLDPSAGTASGTVRGVTPGSGAAG
jgi:sulfoxide reductase heme-binding subunit YedZ